MASIRRPLALPAMQPLCLRAIGVLALAATMMPAPASALIQSWNGYRWARTGPLEIQLGNNLTGAWTNMLQPTADAWSAANNIDFRVVAGRSTASCGAVYGTVQVCNGKYGFNGWLGYANVWLAGGYIVQATVRLNDSYFAAAKYNTSAWREQTICQEVGHTLGLDHTNIIKTNLNTGSCMDYTNDPSGTAGGVNGTLANVGPNAVDFLALAGIYATVNTTQLPSTRPTIRAGAGFGIDGEHHETLAFVPEPDSWMMLILGFGGIGAALRQRRQPAVA